MCEFIQNISSDAVFATLTSITIFVVGFILNKWYDQRRRNDDLETNFSFFLQMLESKIDAIDRQAKSYKTLGESIADTNNRDFSFAIDPKLDFSRINEISQTSLFEYLTNQDRQDDVKHLTEIFNAINTIEKQSENVKRNFDSFLAEVKRFFIEWSEEGNLILRLNDKITHEVKNEDGEENDFFKDFKSIIKDWTEEENQNIPEVYHEKFIKRLHQCALDHLEDERANELLVHTSQSSALYNKIVRLHNFYAPNIKEDHVELLETKEKYEQALKKLKNS